MSASLRRVWGLVFRHVAVYRRSWPRLLELAYWPTLQVLIWGFTSSFFASRLAHAGATQPGAGAIAIGALLGAVLLWEVAMRSQLGVAISFLEEIWSRNLGHLFVSPLRPSELVAALLGVSFLRTVVGIVPAALVTWLLYAYDVLSVGPVLVLFVVNLLVMGWWVSLGVLSVILRHGAGAEAFSWSLFIGVTPFAAVFYPVSVLPEPLRWVADALPASHVFEGLRAVVATGTVRWDELAAASALNLAWLLAAAWLFASQFRAARVSGALVSIGE